MAQSPDAGLRTHTQLLECLYSVGAKPVAPPFVVCLSSCVREAVLVLVILCEYESSRRKKLAR